MGGALKERGADGREGSSSAGSSGGGEKDSDNDDDGVGDDNEDDVDLSCRRGSRSLQ